MLCISLFEIRLNLRISIRLDLLCNNITDHSIKYVAKMRPSTFTLAGSFTDNGLRYLTNAQNLRTLSMVNKFYWQCSDVS